MKRVLVASLFGCLCVQLLACAAQQQTPMRDADVIDAAELDSDLMDATSDDASASDAGVDAGEDASGGYDAGPPGCNWVGGPTVLDVVPLTSINTAFSEMEPFVTADGLRLYFSSDRTGASDIYTATRASLTSSFSSPTLVSWASTAREETRVELSEDGLDLIIAADWTGGAGLSDLYSSHRASTSDPFTSFDPVAAINSSDTEVDPHLTADGLHLYFANTGGGAPTTHHYQILVASRSSTSEAFGAPAVVSALAESSTENSNAILTADQKVVVFTSTRPTSPDMDDANIWYSTRASSSDEFFAPMPMPSSVNMSDATEFEPFVTRDGCQLFFSSDRAGARGTDLYLATIAH